MERSMGEKQIDKQTKNNTGFLCHTEKEYAGLFTWLRLLIPFQQPSFPLEQWKVAESH